MTALPHHPLCECGPCERDRALEAEGTTSTVHLSDLRALYGDPLCEVHGDPFLKRRKLTISTKPRKEAA